MHFRLSHYSRPFKKARLWFMTWALPAWLKPCEESVHFPINWCSLSLSPSTNRGFAKANWLLRKSKGEIYDNVRYIFVFERVVWAFYIYNWKIMKLKLMLNVCRSYPIVATTVAKVMLITSYTSTHDDPAIQL